MVSLPQLSVSITSKTQKVATFILRLHTVNVHFCLPNFYPNGALKQLTLHWLLALFNHVLCLVRPLCMTVGAIIARLCLLMTQAAQTHVTRCNVIYILTFGEAERDL